MSRDSGNRNIAKCDGVYFLEAGQGNFFYQLDADEEAQ